MNFLQDLNQALAQHEQEKSERTVPVRVFDDKSSSMIVWMTPEQARKHKKLTSRRGQQSTIRNVLDGNGRLQAKKF